MANQKSSTETMMAEIEILTSPTEKPKKAACTVATMSPDSIRQGARTRTTATT